MPPGPPFNGAPARIIRVGFESSDSLSNTTIDPAVRWAWIKYSRRGDDGAGIVVSRVSPESEGALALKSLPALPVLPIARLPEAAGPQVGQHSRAWAASCVGIAELNATASKRKAARRRHADRILRRFRQIVGSDTRRKPGPSSSVAGLARIEKAIKPDEPVSPISAYGPKPLGYCGPTVPTGFAYASGVGPALPWSLARSPPSIGPKPRMSRASFTV